MPSGKPQAKPGPPAAPPPPPPRRRRSNLVPRICLAAGVLALLSCSGGLVGLIVGHARDVIPVALPIFGTSVAVWHLTRRDNWNALRRRLGLALGDGELARLLGLALGVGELARRLGVTVEELRGCVPSYREVRIPKKRGGVRLLHVPDDRTKALQRRILHRLLARIPSHPAGWGGEGGRPPAPPPPRHAGRAIVLRFDVIDFFPTTRAGRIERMFHRLGWGSEATGILLRLTTREGGLPQGAPTSPRLSNLVNAGLDRALQARLESITARYTRYADDVVVSFPEDWIGCPEKTLAILRGEFGRRGYRLHGRVKTSVRRRHQRQVVHGLVVNRKVALPRETRRRLRAARHHAATGRPCTFTPEQLEGWAAFESMVRVQGAATPPPWVRERPSTNPRRRP